MSLREGIFQLLEEIAPSYHLDIPEDSEEMPVIRYYFTTQQPAQSGDDKELERRYFLTVDLFSSKPATDKADEIERAIRETLENNFPEFVARRETKDEKIFHYVIEYQFIETL